MYNYMRHKHLHYLNRFICIHDIKQSILSFSLLAGSVPKWRDWWISSSFSQCTQASTHLVTNPHHHQCCFPRLPCLQAAVTHQISEEIPSQKDWSRLTDFSRSSQMHGTCHSCLPPSAQEYEDTDGSFEAAECCWGGTRGHSWGV